jgi:hypothetical protein
VFGIVIPDNNNVGVKTNEKGNTGKSVPGGYHVMIAPLFPGKHVITFEGTLGAGPFVELSQKAKCNVTVHGV